MLILELPFELALDNDPDVKMFFKIPARFKFIVKTPCMCLVFCSDYIIPYIGSVLLFLFRIFD